MVFVVGYQVLICWWVYTVAYHMIVSYSDTTGERDVVLDLLAEKGEYMPTMIGSLYSMPIATLQFLSPHSAVVAFCDGILKHGTAWETLRRDLPMQKDGMTLEEVRKRMPDVLSIADY
ncbi:hypothetical protein POM88_050481 [Heracleum sosnowskyi]|uniref:Uncharacterized protein n=1 Tax=Heracleum sosnowskyi TaxID=360622 RepID=A0AAD8M0F3_9APIA|nr:hypothetical protein POM88_050481 [Heracleum sosnowskyi]